MSDVATRTSDSYATRMDPRDLADMPIDVVGLMQARLDLDLRQLGALQCLQHHLYLYGELPVGIKALAKIVGVGPRSFERMVEALGRHFDRDADGRWSNDRLMRARGNRIVISTPDDRIVDPDLSAKRSRAGKLGAERKQQLRLVTSTDAEGDFASGAAANFASGDSKIAGESGTGVANLPSDLPHALGLTDCYETLDSKGDSSVSQSEPAQANAGSKTSKIDRAFASDSLSNLLGPDGKPLPAIVVGDEDIKAAIVRGAGVKYQVGSVTPDVLATIRKMVLGGCDLGRHYEKALRTFAEKAKGSVRHPACDPVSRMTWELQKAERAAPSNVETVKVYRDDAALSGMLDAILAAMGKTRRAFVSHDANGPYRFFRKDEWDAALRKVASESASADRATEPGRARAGPG